MKSLLDVSVLIALLDEDHIHYAKATTWFQKNLEHGWTTCPLTENGYIRIVSGTGYGNTLSIVESVRRLRNLTTIPYYEFVADDISFRDDTLVDVRLLTGHKQLTDVYLLALAAEHDMRFVTLDTRISTSAVIEADHSNLLII